MQTLDSYQELARRFGFAPTPESVARLTQLISRQDSDMDQVAKVIEEDPALRVRLLRVANPKAESVEDYTVDTVDGALMRNGIGCALLLAMGTPLALALTKTFQTMIGRKLDAIEPHQASPPEGEHLLGMIAFAGKALGRVYLRMSVNSARSVAASILGLDVKELADGPETNDAVGELLNIITGNFKSSLCDAGLDCRLETPEVKRATDCRTPTIPGGGLERMAFRSDEIVIFVDVAVNPWNNE